LDTYMDLLKSFPDNTDRLELSSGLAYLQKKDIFKNVMWYSLSGSSKQYPITIERAIEIKKLNSRGEKPQEIGAVEMDFEREAREMKDAYTDLTGEFSLRGLEKAAKDKRHGKPNKPKPNNKGNAPASPQGNRPAPQGNRPNQAGAPKPAPQMQAPPKGPNPNQGGAPKPAPQMQAPPKGPNPNQGGAPKPAPQMQAPPKGSNPNQGGAPKPAPQMQAPPKAQTNPNANAAPNNGENSSANPNKKKKFKPKNKDNNSNNPKPENN
jgi:hypothetical protein